MFFNNVFNKPPFAIIHPQHPDMCMEAMLGVSGNVFHGSSLINTCVFHNKPQVRLACFTNVVWMNMDKREVTSTPVRQKNYLYFHETHMRQLTVIYEPTLSVTTT
uniref:Myotubularin phosphatase domain-containing protein n=1 Tax=Steinernema glaseri TaxID=37863 RepID=A0A1I7YT00_9BILA